MRTTFRTLTFLVISVLFRCETASSQTVSFAWDEISSTPVTGYAVTIDGVRTDQGLTPLNSSSACGCSIVLPFSGGNHTLKVSAYNSSGEAWSSPLVVAPTAGAGGPYTGEAGTALVVDGSGSKDPAGTIMTYDWNWGDGTSGISSSPATSHLYTTGGAFTLTLKVTDNGGATASANATATIAAKTSGPTVTLTSPGSATVLTYPASTTLAATASASSGTIANVAFYAGSTLISTDTTAPYSVSWTNMAAGAYSVTAVATDSAGLSARSAAVTITVAAASTSAPYLGTPVAIPGTIEAENFDNGADGTAWSDP